MRDHRAHNHHNHSFLKKHHAEGILPNRSGYLPVDLFHFRAEHSDRVHLFEHADEQKTSETPKS